MKTAEEILNGLVFSLNIGYNAMFMCIGRESISTADAEILRTTFNVGRMLTYQQISNMHYFTYDTIEEIAAFVLKYKVLLNLSEANKTLKSQRIAVEAMEEALKTLSKLLVEEKEVIDGVE